MSSSSLSSSPVAAPSPSMEIQIDLPSIDLPSITTSVPTPIPLVTSDECFDGVDAKLINSDDDAKNMKMPSSNNILN